MPFHLESGYFSAAVSNNHINQTANSDIYPYVSVWEKIKVFFCQTHESDALECIRKICHPTVRTTREDVAGRFEQLRKIAYPGYEENIRSGRYAENHFCILDENSREILSLTLNDAGGYIVECEGHKIIHTLTTPSQRAKEYEVVWSDWIRELPPEEAEARNVVVQKMRDCLEGKSASLSFSFSDFSSLPPIPEGVLSLELSNLENLQLMPVLPDSLKKLNIYYCENLDISDLPNGIEELDIVAVNKISFIPDGVRSLTIINCDFSSLLPIPEGVRSLELIDLNNLQLMPVLPVSLKKLSIHCCKKLDISDLPNGIEKLNIREVNKISSIPDGVCNLNMYKCNYEDEITSDSFTNLKELRIEKCDKVKIHEFPSGLELIKIIGDNFSLPNFPDGLLTLSLHYTDNNSVTKIPALPGQLNELNIHFGLKGVGIPTKLPETLSKITITSRVKNQWDISPTDLPRNVNIYTANISFNPKCYNRQDIMFNNVYTDSSVKFESGDIVYGLARRLGTINNIIEKINKFNEKDIIIQSTLTDAVLDKNSYSKFNSDDQIEASLNDSVRGIEFKKFLENHKRYNVTNEHFRDFPYRDIWAKTSKAGLEFQTKVRERKVIFCVDQLIDSIDYIADKRDDYGNAITAHELRWIYRHRDDNKIKENVIFSLKGKLVSQEYVFSLKGWERYQPKRVLSH